MRPGGGSEDNLADNTLDVGDGDIAGHVHDLGTLGAFLAHLGGDGDGDDRRIVADGGEGGVQALTVAGEDVDGIAHVHAVLLGHGEGGGDARRAHLELIVLDIAVEGGLHGAGDGHALVDVHARGRVDGDGNSVVGTDVHGDEEQVSAGHSLFHCLHKFLFVNHIALNCQCFLIRVVGFRKTQGFPGRGATGIAPTPI